MESIGDSLGWGKTPVFKLTEDQKDVDNNPDNADDFKNAQYDSNHWNRKQSQEENLFSFKGLNDTQVQEGVI